MTKAERHYRAALASLARLHGVQTSFVDASGVRRAASPEALAAVLAALGSSAGDERAARLAIERRASDLTERSIEPVTSLWQGRPASIDIARGALPAGALHCRIDLEDGGRLQQTIPSRDIRDAASRSFEGLPREVRRVPLPRGLPMGYHRLTLTAGKASLTSRLLVAPTLSFRHDPSRVEGAWGAFCPLYALRSQRNMGCGDLTDLRELAAWSAGQGGKVVATLPLLAGFLGDRPGLFDPSPYNPVSRLFWNEIFVDPARTDEFASCAAARRLLTSPAVKRRAQALREADLVDYAGVATLKRRVLALLSSQFFSSRAQGSPGFAQFLKENPLARSYARFRAVTERQGRAWSAWPAAARRGRFTAKDFDPADERYHLYAQYAASTQLRDTAQEVRARGGLVYLDLPVGVSPDGFDVFRQPELFATTCSTGAPPDPYFTGGQDWGFPPAHPETCRDDGYAAFIAALRAHMRVCDYLRLDHVMAFHRLFWVPVGMGAAHGVYVSYRAAELYAILCIESHRHRCRLVGENLGTVPPAVNAALAKHDLCGLYVAQYELRDTQPALRTPPRNCVASINTHDMATMATTWSGDDIDDRIRLGMLPADQREAHHEGRKRGREALVTFLRERGLLAKGRADLPAVRDALVAFLGASPADFALVNIEDLWLETRWQNIPGTMNEHPNWRHKLRLGIQEIRADPKIATLLARLDALRRKTATHAAPASASNHQAGAKPARSEPARSKPARSKSKLSPAAL